MKTVYLAGGFTSDWQSHIKQITGFTFIDPREKELGKEWDLERIGAWDLSQIGWSDIVFAYMERTNPSGFGLASEIGYAYGLGKTVILVLETEHTLHKDKYLNFLKKVATITFDKFENGVKFLETLK